MSSRTVTGRSGEGTKEINGDGQGRGERVSLFPPPTAARSRNGEDSVLQLGEAEEECC